jgi:FkbM family methyltransferase
VRLTSKLLKNPRLLAALAAAAAAVALLFPYLKAAALWVAGRNGGCSLEASLQAPSEARGHQQARERIEKALRRLRADPEGLELWDTPAGPLWAPGRGRTGYWLADLLAEAQADPYAHGAVRVRPGDVVLDCGASIGTFARKALSLGARTVVAIEPGPDSVECLRRNLAAEINAGRLIVYPKGVWNREGTLRLLIDSNSSLGDSLVFRRGAGQLGIEVPLTRIDTLVSELSLARVDFIKMDIEGSEQQALEGAQETLRRFRPRLALSAYHRREDPVRIPALVRAARPDYRLAGGPCAVGRYRLGPKVLFFE